MPAIKNFRERKLLKDILELRDQNGLVTYTYVFSEMTATWTFFCNSVGYGVPYATQYTNPERFEYNVNGPVTLPQADPTGLFSPASAEGTWVMCKDPSGKDVKPVYVEPRIIVSPFKLADPGYDLTKCSGYKDLVDSCFTNHGQKVDSTYPAEK
jgi:hypothetical protein